MRSRTFSYATFSSFLVLLVLVFPATGLSGEWRISPTRVDLDRDNRNGEITVRNDGDEKVNLQVKAVEWTQDQDGKDRYADTSELVFFPKMMSLAKDEEKVIRTGTRALPVSREKTYRLMVQEIPEPRKTATPTVAIALKFSVPVFVKPLKDETKGELEKLELSHGKLSARVRNTGTSHFRILSVTVTGKNRAGEQTFSKSADGWYLLSGISRSYPFEITPADCAKSSLLEVSVKSDRLSFEKSLQVDTSMCTP